MEQEDLVLQVEDMGEPDMEQAEVEGMDSADPQEAVVQPEMEAEVEAEADVSQGNIQQMEAVTEETEHLDASGFAM